MLLLPPSEGKAPGGSTRGASGPWDPAAGAFGRLGPQRAAVADALEGLDGGDERLLGARGDNLARAQTANASLRGSPTLPAWRRYTGVVWEHLDPATLPPAARRKIVVVSGLLGLARADDRIPDYRLKMSASPSPLGKLSTWWRGELSAVLNAAARRRVVIDLLPNEHRAAWTPAVPDGVRVTFVERHGAPGGHFAKAAKGRFARAVLTEGLGALDTWRDERFELSISPL
ncbi:MAG: peroxide stress protein YaaA [Ilumatobacter sp.]|nr:peroxide stress protein YaaA [Ilumatobacter sp.]